MMQNKMTAPPLQGISNLMKMQGRMGDTELVHMTKPEVKGLASLGVLTTNPNTGLPEAFFGSFGRAFTNYIIPAALTIASGGNPGPAAAYSGLKGTIETGNPIVGVQDALFSYGGAKLGQGLGELVGQGLGQVGGDVAKGGLDATAAEALSREFGSKAAEIGGQQFGNLIGQAGPAALGDVASTYATKGLGEGLKTMACRELEYAKTPEGIGQALGSTVSQMGLDAAKQQQELQSQNIPEEVKDAEKVEFSTGKLKNINPQYADRDLSASRIVGAMQGTQAPLQFTDPSYSPAVTGNLSSILGAKDGGAMSNLKERAMGSQSKGLADALESITEGAEDIVDMGGGQVYFEGMVKGDGDGMSDEIPFSIEGQQPALLSRDEYVLPADVVSALGNGSSNAGADMLDKFMTDVREKTMGRERQINQIG